MPPVVMCKDLQFSYRDAPVLQDVSFSLAEGSFTAVIGPNGGGKTTLLKLIMGFLTASRGKIQIFGKSVKQARSILGYVPQVLKYDRQFPVSVLDVVLMGRLSKVPWFRSFGSDDYERALYALQEVGLENFENRAFGELSGGQAQRVLIARALASDPRLLILDEPTANVDAQTEGQIYRLLQKLKKEHGVSILMVTHQLQALINHVDQVLCVHRAVSSLAPEQVCEHFPLGLYHGPLIRKERS